MRILLVNPNISESVSELIGAEARRAASASMSAETLAEMFGLMSRIRMGVLQEAQRRGGGSSEGRSQRRKRPLPRRG